jgi:hypothetical protein
MSSVSWEMRAERAHVVGAVGQLDQNHAHIARHGQQHLAKRLRLVFLARVEGEFFQFGQAIDQFGHRCAKALDQLGLAHAAVFNGVVQQGGHQGLRIELPVGALGGHRDRMGDVGLTAAAQLAQMGLVGKAVGLAHQRDVFPAQIAELGRQRSKARCCGIGGGGARSGGRQHGRLQGAHAPTLARADRLWRQWGRPSSGQIQKSTALAVLSIGSAR